MHFKFKSKSIVYISIIAIILFCACSQNKETTKTIHILTIGNSFAVNALHYLDEITESVPGCEIKISRANIGGASLKKHADLIAACKKDTTLKPYRQGPATLEEILKRDKYDIITIQQVSSSSFRPEDYQPYADILIDFIKTYAPSSKIMIHQTWAYSPTCKRLKGWGITRDEMHAGLQKCYNGLAAHTNFDLLLSGNAFYRSFNEEPNIYLWRDDGFHANFNGCYLAGCVWFGTLFNVSPEKIQYVPEELNQQTAEFLRKIAAKEIKSN